MFIKKLLIEPAVQLQSCAGHQNILVVKKGAAPGSENGWVLVLNGFSIDGYTVL